VRRLSEVILQLRQKEFTIVMAEQNFHFAASLADRMYVVERGRVVVEIAKHEVEGSRQLLRELLGV
jgi:branched-chain amino acid transport system ATP-binding protein